MSAPDRKVRLGYLPEGDDDGLWRINAYKDPFGPPTWGICFNDSAPDEFVHAFTTALAKAYEQGSDAYLMAPDTRHADRDPFLAVAPLVNRGWQLDRPRWASSRSSPPTGSPGWSSPPATSTRRPS